MCALQPRQLFARALLMPRLTSSPLNVSYAHLSMQPAAFASSPSSVTRQRRHPAWGTAGGCAGIFWGAVGMRERMGSAPRALPWRAGRCSVVGRLAGWYLRGSGGVWGLQGGAGGSSLSCVMNPSLTAPRGSPRDARAAVAQVAQTRVPQSRQIPAPVLCRGSAGSRSCVHPTHPRVLLLLGDTIPQPGKPSGCHCPDAQRGRGTSGGVQGALGSLISLWSCPALPPSPVAL